ncbi:MAG: hypothetical protein EZS28_001130 [Streblomastix strix]|uniref:Uncharacterized protein n=1 Tax=Streblomastix strix TaxID=222440 RepID=A0A5J4X9W5_9EUKA|nr:MAG: hypothetical protein EZS28_001130 [Streblomastix strix]
MALINPQFRSALGNEGDAFGVISKESVEKIKELHQIKKLISTPTEEQQTSTQAKSVPKLKINAAAKPKLFGPIQKKQGKFSEFLLLSVLPAAQLVNAQQLLTQQGPQTNQFQQNIANQSSNFQQAAQHKFQLEIPSRDGDIEVEEVSTESEVSANEDDSVEDQDSEQ